MKKKLVALAFVAISLISFSSLAQNDAPAKSCDLAGQAACNKDKKCDKPCPFDGLNITDAQKAQLQQLQQAKREQAKQQKQEKRCEMKAERQQAKRQYLADVKAILTPDQYVLFLENFYVNTNPGGMHHKQAMKHCKGDGKKAFTTAKDGRPGKTRDLKRPDKKAKAGQLD